MGQEIEHDNFSAQDFEEFQQRLLENLQGLKTLLANPDFGKGPASIGAELELYLVDKNARPLPMNREVIGRSGHKQLALELNRFNLEYNLSPVPAAGNPFAQLEEEMIYAIQLVNEQLAHENGFALPIGILPTLKRNDFGLQAMTDESRFYALTKALQRLRGRMFCIRIDGEDPISLRSHDVTLEGANCSMQVHFRVNPSRFADTFNALQFVTPVVLALGANSPFMLGHKLWHETRVPLFRQTIDGRTHEECERALPSRVDFGNGWVREGAYELFAEAVRLYEPILPVVGKEKIDELINQGKMPVLNELRLHTGTIWPWNRAVYDANDGGHLRVEMRALPSGPTPIDMIANTAFALGAAKGLQEQMEEIIPALPFATQASNFYLAAEKGIQADLMWPDLNKPGGLLKKNVIDIAVELLPIAEQGLQQLGVDEAEVKKYLGVIKQRLDKKISGAVWQRREYQRQLKHKSEHAALTAMVQGYMKYSSMNIPVAEWENVAGQDEK